MVYSVQYETATFLSKDVWRASTTTTTTSTGTDNQLTSTYEERLYDLSFDLAALLQDSARYRLDAPQPPAVDSSFLQRLQALQARCVALREAFEGWYKALETVEGEGPLYADAEDAAGAGDTDDTGHALEVMPRNLTFSNLRIAHALVNYWTLCLLLGQLVSSLPTSTEPADSALSSITTPNPSSTSFSLTLATLIVRSIPYCTSLHSGLLGPLKSLFPLRMALEVVQIAAQREAVVEYVALAQRAENLYEDMRGRVGLRLAGDLDVEWGVGVGARGQEGRRMVVRDSTGGVG